MVATLAIGISAAAIVGMEKQRQAYRDRAAQDTDVSLSDLGFNTMVALVAALFTNGMNTALWYASPASRHEGPQTPACS